MGMRAESEDILEYSRYNVACELSRSFDEDQLEKERRKGLDF